MSFLILGVAVLKTRMFFAISEASVFYFLFNDNLLIEK